MTKRSDKENVPPQTFSSDPNNMSWSDFLKQIENDPLPDENELILPVVPSRRKFQAPALSEEQKEKQRLRKENDEKRKLEMKLMMKKKRENNLVAQKSENELPTIPPTTTTTTTTVESSSSNTNEPDKFSQNIESNETKVLLSETPSSALVPKPIPNTLPNAVLLSETSSSAVVSKPTPNSLPNANVVPEVATEVIPKVIPEVVTEVKVPREVVVPIEVPKAPTEVIPNVIPEVVTEVKVPLEVPVEVPVEVPTKAPTEVSAEVTPKIAHEVASEITSVVVSEVVVPQSMLSPTVSDPPLRKSDDKIISMQKKSSLSSSNGFPEEYPITDSINIQTPISTSSLEPTQVPDIIPNIQEISSVTIPVSSISEPEPIQTVSKKKKSEEPIPTQTSVSTENEDYLSHIQKKRRSESLSETVPIKLDDYHSNPIIHNQRSVLTETPIKKIDNISPSILKTPISETSQSMISSEPPTPQSVKESDKFSQLAIKKPQFRTQQQHSLPMIQESNSDPGLINTDLTQKLEPVKESLTGIQNPKSEPIKLEPILQNTEKLSPLEQTALPKEQQIKSSSEHIRRPSLPNNSLPIPKSLLTESPLEQPALPKEQQIKSSSEHIRKPSLPNTSLPIPKSLPTESPLEEEEPMILEAPPPLPQSIEKTLSPLEQSELPKEQQTKSSSEHIRRPSLPINNSLPIPKSSTTTESDNTTILLKSQILESSLKIPSTLLKPPSVLTDSSNTASQTIQKSEIQNLETIIQQLKESNAQIPEHQPKLDEVPKDITNLYTLKMHQLLTDHSNTLVTAYQKDLNESKVTITNLEKKANNFKTIAECLDKKCQKLENEVQSLKSQNSELVVICNSLFNYLNKFMNEL